MQASKQEWDIRKLRECAIKYFNLKEIPQHKLSAELLLSSVLGLSRMQLYLNFGYILKEKELAKFKEYILRRLKNEPVQYILKERGKLLLEGDAVGSKIAAGRVKTIPQVSASAGKSKARSGK